MNDNKLDFLLDLFDVGYKNAYVSTMDYVSDKNITYNCIEIYLQNVGNLRLMQSFDERLDDQIPHIDVFYTSVLNTDFEAQIKNMELLNRAIRIIYKAKKYFEMHPEHIVNNKDLIGRIQKNEKFFQKQCGAFAKKRYGILQTFIKEK